MLRGDWRDGDGLLTLDRLKAPQAIVLLAAAAILVALGLSLALSAPRTTTHPGSGSDGLLYEAVIGDVAQGQSYYAAAAREHRRIGAPLRPFVTVRPPLLAEGLAKLPDVAARTLALAALAATTFAAWTWRLRGLRHDPVRYAWALTLLVGGIGLALSSGSYLFHEEWAGLLMALALAVRTPRSWMLSLALGLLAALLRELAFPFLAAMAFAAFLERRRLEAAAWIGALLVAALALAAHAQQVAAVTNASDLASPGWTSFGGWGFILRLAQLDSFLLAAPLWVPALLLPLALLGLLFWADGGETGVGRRTALVVWGYVLAFCVVGRANNDYWGLLLAPLWPLGLIQSDRVVAGLFAHIPWLDRPAAERP